MEGKSGIHVIQKPKEKPSKRFLVKLSSVLFSVLSQPALVLVPFRSPFLWEGGGVGAGICHATLFPRNGLLFNRLKRPILRWVLESETEGQM